MKQLFFLIILMLAVFSTKGNAQDNSFFLKGEKSPNVHHVGDVWLKEINSADTIFNNSISIATFGINARLDWHKHPGGQILMFTEGEGYYQEKGKFKQTVRKGEMIKCLPDVEHWHGATPKNGVTYIASSPTQKGKTIWLKRVTDEDYNSNVDNQTNLKSTSLEQEVINLSKKKWLWMSDKNVDSLNTLFNEKSVFVHMGGSWGKKQEINIIKSGKIWYKNAEIQETSVTIIGNTAILLSKIILTAVVGSKEVINPFMVTEVYIYQDNSWTLSSLSFTKLLTP